MDENSPNEARALPLPTLEPKDLGVTALLAVFWSLLGLVLLEASDQM